MTMERQFDMKGLVNAWNAHAVERIVDFYAEDAEMLALPNQEPYRGREGVRKNALDTLKGLPDINGDLAWSVQQGDRVAALVHVSGRHTGPLELSPEQVIEPTGKDVHFELGTFIELDGDGKIRRETQVINAVGLLMQVGLLETGAQAAGARGSAKPTRAR